MRVFLPDVLQKIRASAACIFKSSPMTYMDKRRARSISGGIRARVKVSALVSFGVPQTDVAKHIGIDAKTLTKHYRAELDAANLEANFMVAKRLFVQATGDSVAAAIYWLKCRAGWKDATKLEHSLLDGAPINAQTAINMRSLSNAELAALTGVMRKLNSGSAVVVDSGGDDD